MATSKDDIKYGTAQAKLSEDEALRVAYKHGAPLEAGKIADSEPVDLFKSAHNIQKKSSDHEQDQDQGHQSSPPQPKPNSGSAKYPTKTTPSLATK